MYSGIFFDSFIILKPFVCHRLLPLPLGGGGALLIVVKYATLTVAVLKEKTVRCAAHQGTLLYIDKI